jgi:hypothetical protein
LLSNHKYRVIWHLLLSAGATFLAATTGHTQVQSCFAPITAASITLEAQVQSLQETISANGVVNLSSTINWDDGSMLTGQGSGTFTHAYVSPGTYEPTIAGTGILNNLPCSTPPTVFANVTVTPCTGSNCLSDSVIAQLKSLPPGRFQSAPAGQVAHCDDQPPTSGTPPVLSGLRVFYANNIPNIPQGWPIIEFCATGAGLADLDIFLQQGAPGLRMGVVFDIAINVHPGINDVVPQGPPPPTARFGFLGPFYVVETDQTKGQTVRRPISWASIPCRFTQPGITQCDTPVGPLPRLLSPSTTVSSAVVAGAP